MVKTRLSLLEKLRLFREKRVFRRVMGYPCDLDNPKTYSEKITWRKVFDRNPLFPVVQDKLRARDYAREMLGDKEAEEILVPLYFVTGDPEKIPFDTLPDRYVIKANHGCGWMILVEDGRKVDRRAVVRRCRKWLKTTYGKRRMEWAYSQMKPQVYGEEYLVENGKVPTDYKFLVFGGKVRLVYAYYDRFGEPSEAFFDEKGRRLYIAAKHEAESGLELPSNFGKMAAIAERLASPFDYLRVDLYSFGGKIRLGEMTVYPGSGTYPYPRHMDDLLGSFWKLPGTGAQTGGRP